MTNESRKRLWPDEDEWLDFFREHLCGHPELAEQLARIWYALLEHLGHGTEGLLNARFILKQPLRLTYPFTSSYRLAYRHYRLSLSGYVKPDDEPDRLFGASITRARAEIEKSRVASNSSAVPPASSDRRRMGQVAGFEPGSHLEARPVMSDESHKRLWPDEDDWLDFFRENLCGRPELAEQVARICYALLEHLGQGPEGLRNARFILKQALRLTYPFTSSCRLAYRHYRLSLSGYVKPDDEPGHLLGASITRARAQIAKSRAKKKQSGRR
jgi:hypothetical protein